MMEDSDQGMRWKDGIQHKSAAEEDLSKSNTIDQTNRARPPAAALHSGGAAPLPTFPSSACPSLSCVGSPDAASNLLYLQQQQQQQQQQGKPTDQHQPITNTGIVCVYGRRCAWTREAPATGIVPKHGIKGSTHAQVVPVGESDCLVIMMQRQQRKWSPNQPQRPKL
jgi:hypothetical protein